jgi:ferredoxin
MAAPSSCVLASDETDTAIHPRNFRERPLMKLRIDAEMCTGHGRCYALAPEVFEPDEDGHGVVLARGDVPAGLEEVARRAANNCPERAITVEE